MTGGNTHQIGGQRNGTWAGFMIMMMVMMMIMMMEEDADDNYDEMRPGLEQSKEQNERGGNPPHSGHPTPSSENNNW